MNFLTDISDKSKWSAVVALILTAPIFLVAQSFPTHDFANYYFSALSLLTQNSMDIYDPWLFNEFIQEQGVTDAYANYSPHTPLTRYFFLPFTLLSVGKAKFLFNLTGLVLFFWSLYKLNEKIKLNPLLILLIPFVFGISLLTGFWYGQAYLWLTSFLILTYTNYVEGNTRMVSFLLFLSIILKFTPIFFLIYFFIKREFRILMNVLILVVGISILDLLISGNSNWMIYFSEIIPRASDGLVNATYSSNNHSFLSLLKKAFIYDPDYLQKPLFQSTGLYFYFKSFYAISLIAMAWLLTRKEDDLISFSFWTFVIYAIPSIGSLYSGILLVLPLLVILLRRKKLDNVLVFAFIFILCSIQLIPVLRNYHIELFVLILLLFLFVFMRPYLSTVIRAVGLAAILSIPFSFSFFPGITGSSMIEVNNTLIYNKLEIRNNKLIAQVYGFNGPEQKVIIEDISGKDVQLLTETELNSRLYILHRANWKNGVLIDGSELLFLSDERHGYHFYQLRKLPM